MRYDTIRDGAGRLINKMVKSRSAAAGRYSYSYWVFNSRSGSME